MGEKPAAPIQHPPSSNVSEAPASFETARASSHGESRVSRSGTAPLASTPATDDIDSEWPSEPDASAAPLVAPEPNSASSAGSASAGLIDFAESSASDVMRTGALASSSLPATRVVDPGWLPGVSAAPVKLSSPKFPADPGLPRDLKAVESPAARGVSSELGPTRSKRDVDTIPAAPQASRPPAALSSGRALRTPRDDVEKSAEPGAPTEASAADKVASDAVVGAAPSPAPREAEHSAVPALDPLPARSASRLPVVLGVLAVIVVGIWFLRSSKQAREEEAASARAASARARTSEAARAVPASTAVATGAAQAAPAAAVAAASAVTPAPSAPASEPTAPTLASATPSAAAAEAAALAASAEPAPAPSANPATAPPASAAANGGKVSVVISVRPPQARIFRHGKEVGRAPVTIELDPGEKRFFEVGAPGFTTRKVVIDGSKTEVFVGLRPDPNAPSP